DQAQRLEGVVQRGQAPRLEQRVGGLPCRAPRLDLLPDAPRRLQCAQESGRLCALLEGSEALRRTHHLVMGEQACAAVALERGQERAASKRLARLGGTVWAVPSVDTVCALCSALCCARPAAGTRSSGGGGHGQAHDLQVFEQRIEAGEAFLLQQLAQGQE